MSDETRTAALEILRTLVGAPDADFHDGQFEAIRSLVDERSRALVVQRTGWGKSAVYFVATLLLRRRGGGPTVLVSPLLALMRDQIAAAERAGVRAVAINSTNAHEWSDVLGRLQNDDVDVLLLSPERLNNPAFRDEQLPALVERMGMLVVDEAHCISDWGHDFRPDYRRLGELIRRLPAGVPILATTATANSRVVTDVEEQLAGGGVEVVTIRGPLARASLRLGVLRLSDARARLAWLLTHLGDLPGSGIIYSLTVSGAQDVARLLRDAGHDVRAYTGQTDAAEREESEALLKANRVKALVATSALGMGFDKPDLGFVVHLGAPSSPVAYYQQVGRAGRATENADVLLLPGPRRPRHLALLRDGVDAHAGARRAGDRRARRPPAVHSGPGGARRHPSHAAGAAAQGARRGRCGAPGARRLGRDRRAVDLRRRALRAHRAGAPDRAAAHARLRAHGRMPDGVPPAHPR